MTIDLSEMAANAMLDVLAGLMDGGRIEFLSVSGNKLAVLPLASPAASDAADGELVLNPIGEEDAALARGEASTARIVDQAGELIMTVDVGTEESDAVVKLNTTQIHRNSPVRIRSFTLAMP